MATKKNIKKEIIKLYSNQLLTENKSFNSIYELCVKLEIVESDFYEYFPNFEAIEEELLKELINSSLEVLKNTKEFETYDTKNKLLSFYFTFFETLTLNRSMFLRLINLKSSKIQQLKKIESFKPAFLEFIHELNINIKDFSSDNLHKIQEKTIDLSLWAQLLLTIKFWIDDTSNSFEKTDIFIEKSIHTSFNLIQNNALNSVIDLGKFIWKEKFLKMKA